MNDRLQNALLGALVGDAVAMPVHWYFDTVALDRDCGQLQGYAAPRNPHGESDRWHSKYVPRESDAEILHDHIQHWGQDGIHYHQRLPAGDNTLDFLLGIQLYRWTIRHGIYDADAWLDLYIELMRKPGWHSDTYVEEYHRIFFANLAAGKNRNACSTDLVRIDGLVSVPFLVAALDALGETDPVRDRRIVRDHVAMTHNNEEVLKAAEVLTLMLHALSAGRDTKSVISEYGCAWVEIQQLQHWATVEDRDVVGRQLSSDGDLPESLTSALFIVWKYCDDFSAGVLANARCGGDTCHRAAVVGSLLAAANDIPERWLRELRSLERLRCDTLDPIFTK